MSGMNTNFETLVENLLQKYECVILPEFGGFIVRESPCNFSASGDRIKPYSKHIFFNPHLTLNDGLVYNEIQTVLGYTYNEAINWYKQQIERYKQLITDAGSAHFGQLGTFFQGKENNYWFSPSSDLNLAKSTYGLFPVDIHKIAKQEAIAVEEPIKVVELKSKVEADRKPIESIEPSRLNYKAWAAAAVVALLVHFTYLKLEKTDVTTNEASVLLTFPSKTETQAIETPAITDTVAYQPIDTSAETIENTVTSTPESPVIDNEPVVSEAPVQTQVAEPAPAEKTVAETEVIPNESKQIAPESQFTRVARYRLESNAIYHKRDLEKKGKVVIIDVVNGLYEVYVQQ